MRAAGFYKNPFKSFNIKRNFDLYSEGVLFDLFRQKRKVKMKKLKVVIFYLVSYNLCISCKHI